MARSSSVRKRRIGSREGKCNGCDSSVASASASCASCWLPPRPPPSSIGTGEPIRFSRSCRQRGEGGRGEEAAAAAVPRRRHSRLLQDRGSAEIDQVFAAVFRAGGAVQQALVDHALVVIEAHHPGMGPAALGPPRLNPGPGRRRQERGREARQGLQWMPSSSRNTVARLLAALRRIRGCGRSVMLL